MYIVYNTTICSVYPIENYNRGMGDNSKFSRPTLPTYRGCTVYTYINTYTLIVYKCNYFLHFQRIPDHMNECTGPLNFVMMRVDSIL